MTFKPMQMEDFFNTPINAMPKKKKLKPIPAKTLDRLDVSMIKTQKALGIRALLDQTGSDFQIFPAVYGPHRYPEPEPQLYPHNKITVKSRVFARPCPVTPRHGFVDSIPVTSAPQVRKLYQRVKKEDPNGEVLLMPLLSGRISAVATNAGVTWGHGNAGVTDAKGEVIMIPTPGTSLKEYKAQLLHRWTYADYGSRMEKSLSDTPYLEIVEGNGVSRIVQVRNGPEQPTTVNFIPRRMKVEKIITKKGFDDHSLIAWERHLKALKGTPGLVINLHNSSLSSHYAVHGIEMDIPVVTSHQVLVGDELIPEANSSNAFVRPMKQQLVQLSLRMKSALASDYIPKDHDGQVGVVSTTVATIHAMTQWNYTARYFTKLRAQAFVSLIRFGAAAVIGELRHFHSSGPGRSGKEMKTNIWDIVGLNTNQRDLVYGRMLLPMDLSYLRTILPDVIYDFSHGAWASSFGGSNWAIVAEQTLNLVKLVEKFTDKAWPSQENWTELVLAANILVHTMHNGGYALSKWTDHAHLSMISKAPVFGFLNTWAGTQVLSTALEPLQTLYPTRGMIA